MRRKSERNKNKSPEKKLVETPPPAVRKSKRHSRKQRSPSPEESDQDVKTDISSEQVKTPPSKSPSNSDDERTTLVVEKPIWKVQTAADSAGGGELQKIKICLTRPTPTTPERREKSPRRKRHKSASNHDDSEERRESRKSRRRGSPAVATLSGLEDSQSQESQESQQEEYEGKFIKDKQAQEQHEILGTESVHATSEPVQAQMYTMTQNEPNVEESIADDERDDIPKVVDKDDKDGESHSKEAKEESKEIVDDLKVEDRKEEKTNDSEVQPPINIEEKVEKSESTEVEKKVDDEISQPTEIAPETDAKEIHLQPALSKGDKKIETNETVVQDQLEQDANEDVVTDQAKSSIVDLEIENPDVETTEIGKEDASEVQKEKPNSEINETLGEICTDKIKEDAIEQSEAVVSIENSSKVNVSKGNDIEQSEAVVSIEDPSKVNVSKGNDNEQSEAVVSIEDPSKVNISKGNDIEQIEDSVKVNVSKENDIQRSETVVSIENLSKVDVSKVQSAVECIDPTPKVHCSTIEKTEENQSTSTVSDAIVEIKSNEQEIEKPEVEEKVQKNDEICQSEKDSGQSPSADEASASSTESSDADEEDDEKDERKRPIIPEATAAEKETNKMEAEKVPEATETVEETQSVSEKKRKRTWLSVSNSLPRITIVNSETIRSICPNIEIIAENQLKFEAIAKKSEKQSSSNPAKFERKVSIEHRLEKKDPAISAIEDDDGISGNSTNIISFNRKISIVDDEASKLQPPPQPAKNPVSSVLYITNLVRPFTLKQLKELLSRMGTIVDNGFWTDRIKSKCYVQYENEENAEATRNALHGVQWPIGNGKKLEIEYATVEQMEAAKNAIAEEAAAAVAKILPAEKENAVPLAMDEVKKKDPKGKEVPVREWDLGKIDYDKEKRRSHSRDRHMNDGRDQESGRNKRRHSRHSSPIDTPVSRKQQKKDEEVPAKLMDDLFHKTATTPSIYWLPLTPEQIATKQQERLERMAEHKRRMEESRGRSDFGRGGTFRRR